jgi:hypothetical protein
MDAAAQPFVSQPFCRIEPLSYDLPANSELVLAEQLARLEKREQQHAGVAP